MVQTSKCPICSSYRNLPSHLFELSEYCRLLENTVSHEKFGEVKTKVMGDWLKLASQLEKVDINAWKFAAESEVWCGSSGDAIDSESEHYTDFVTPLIRFSFVSNALEEIYRFIVSHYDELPKENRRNYNKPSMKACVLADHFEQCELPEHFNHAQGNLNFKFNKYIERVSPKVVGMDDTQESDASYGLHQIRNLRNHIMHGGFPIVENPDFSGCWEVRNEMITLMNCASRSASLFIQMFLMKYNNGFLSDDYLSCGSSSDDPREGYFIRNCTIKYAKTLHLMGDFSFQDKLGYEVFDY